LDDIIIEDEETSNNTESTELMMEPNGTDTIVNEIPLTVLHNYLPTSSNAASGSNPTSSNAVKLRKTRRQTIKKNMVTERRTIYE
jgi:hypothetical protein